MIPQDERGRTWPQATSAADAERIGRWADEERDAAAVRALEDAHEAADAAAYEARDAGYNGWRNRETWNVGLWLSNDEPLYRVARSLTGLAAAADDPTDALARALRGFVEAYAETHGDGFGDLDAAELAAVDWDEIAAAWLEED